ncbi:MAG TPA: hypothetical protein VLA34_09085, partial [Candidatus Krumholzibacterium sp.]|nr:hypothetical protein [Candidatus Krumholzibacterium sp.]
MITTRSAKVILIAAILAAATAPPAGARRGCDDILTPKFALEEVVDLGQEIFSGAAGLLSRGDSAACREEILNVFLSGGPAAGFSPWPAREDAVRRARLFLDDKYMLGVHPGYLLKGDLRWNENPAGS